MRITHNKLIATLLLIVTLLSVLVPVKVFAGANPDALGEAEKTRAESLYKYLIANGYSAEAACGILGNADQESGFSDAYNSGSRSYYGYFQMSSDSWSNLKAWASSSSLDYNDITTQFKYVEANGLDMWTSVLSSPSFDAFKTTSNVQEAAEAFMAAYERCVVKKDKTGYKCTAVTLNTSYLKDSSTWKYPAEYQEGQTRVDYANAFATAFAGITPDPEASGPSDNIGEGALKGMVYTEEELSAYRKLGEMNIDEIYLSNAHRDSLSQQDIENLANWERNINNNTSDSGAIHCLRIFVMFMGIILIVWSVIIYLSYWFDRINNFIDLDLLGILTFNKLHISDTEEECTFHLKTLGKTDKKTVNHRAVCIVCITGICFGTLIVSGTLYKLLNSFINLVLRLLGTV